MKDWEQIDYAMAGLTKALTAVGMQPNHENLVGLLS